MAKGMYGPPSSPKLGKGKGKATIKSPATAGMGKKRNE